MLQEVLKTEKCEIFRIVSSIFHTNTYIIHSGTRVLVVDPGFDKFHTRELGQVVQLLKSMKPAEVLIVNTHGHLDHFCGNLKLRRVLEGENIRSIIMTHQDDAYLLRDFSEHFEIQNIVPEYSLDIFDAEPHSPDRVLQDGDLVEVGALRFRVIHCPGHTRGSMVLYEDDLKILVTGDVVLDGGIGRVDLPHSNPVSMYRSITRLLAEVDLSCRVLPGHGGTFILKEQAHYILQEAMLLAQF